MRIFENFIEADREIERELLHNGLVYQSETWQNKNVRDNKEFETRELFGYSFLTRPQSINQIKEYSEYRKCDWNWLWNERTERLLTQPKNPGDAWKLRKDVWEQFLVFNEFDDFGHFDYFYPERISSQVNDVIELLKKIPSSRHGLIFIYDPAIDNKRRYGTHRVPCSIYYQALIRNRKLDFVYNIRSNDYFGHFPYDLILAWFMQEFIASHLNLPVGDLLYQSISLHAFNKDIKEIY